MGTELNILAHIVVYGVEYIGIVETAGYNLVFMR